MIKYANFSQGRNPEIKHIKKFMGDDEIIIFLNTPHSLISDKTDVHTDQVNIFHRYPCNIHVT